MKAYIGNVDWADEGDIFFYSIISEEHFNSLYNLFNILLDLDMLPETWEFYWGTNEFFEFTPDDIKEFFEDAEYIEEYELEVFQKFGVDGYDIYDIIANRLFEVICIYRYNVKYNTKEFTFNRNLTEKDIEAIKPLFISIFSEEEWNEIKKYE